jgi:hypothetical protein
VDDLLRATAHAARTGDFDWLHKVEQGWRPIN